ncbi:MAG: hypothetical protein QOI41_6643, partial [Myxococcales bacterium]|nr:hypothetical protein [Myxococcales bacterium]
MVKPLNQTGQAIQPSLEGAPALAADERKTRILVPVWAV